MVKIAKQTWSNEMEKAPKYRGLIGPRTKSSGCGIPPDIRPESIIKFT